MTSPQPSGGASAHDRRASRLFLLAVIVPLAVLWLVLRVVLDVPIAIVTVVVTVLAVASVVVASRMRRRSERARGGLGR